MTEFQGRIYRLFIEGFEEVCYIGSTTLSLEMRYTHHTSQVKSAQQAKCAASSLFEEGNDVKIALVEEGPFESKAHMEQRERYWIEKNPDCVNKNIPGRGWKERWVANRAHNLQKQKEWKAANKEHIAAYAKANREHIKAQEKVRYDAGYKDKRNEAKKVKAKCEECGKEMNKNSLWLHRKTTHAPKPS